VLAVVVLLGLPAGALADQTVSTSGSFGITPARRHVVGEPGVLLNPTAVINSTDSPYKVTVFPVMLTQDITGAFNFSSQPGALAAAQGVLGVAPTSFTLLPYSKQVVKLHWNGMPKGRLQVPAGVVFQGIRQQQKGPVTVITRLLSVNFLTLPVHLRVSGRFVALTAMQFGRRVLRFMPIAQNTGQRAWAPSDGTFQIRNSAGRIVYRTPWVGDVIIPGAEREFPINVAKILPAGRYTMQAGMDFAGHKSISGRFTLTGPNQLPSAHLTVTGVNGSGTSGSRPQVSVTARNQGTAPGPLVVHVRVIGACGRAQREHYSAAHTFTFSGVPGGASRTMTRALAAPLPTGCYSVQANWVDPSGQNQSAANNFNASPKKSVSNQIWSWITGHWWLFLGLAVLLVIALLVRELLRRQRRLERALAAIQAQSAAGSAPFRHPSGTQHESSL
jgi:hypothetical protein